MHETNKALILDPDVYMPTITFIFLREFGTDALAWEPEVIKHELEAVVGQSVPEKNLDKINTGTTIIYTNAGEIYPDLFEKMCLVAHNDFPDTDTWQPITPEQLMQGLVDFQILTSREFKPWNDVTAYIKAVLFDHGYVSVPHAIAVLTSMDDTSIPHGGNNDVSLNNEKEDAAQEYITEIIRVRTAQMEKITHEPKQEDKPASGDTGETTGGDDASPADSA